MYVLVHHVIRDPARFWALAEQATTSIPAGLTLHQSLPARDGTRATCLWEGASVDAVQRFLEPLVGDISANEYREAENREGVALPSLLPA
jgi:hypothetical protein